MPTAEQVRTLSPDSAPEVRSLRKPYLVFLGDVRDALTAKTGYGLRDWVREDLVGQWRFATGAAHLGLPEMTPEEAVGAGAGSIVIGAAPAGGQLPPHWENALARATHAGLDLVSGLHTKLAARSKLAAAAEISGVAIHDVRHFDGPLPIGTGTARSGRRLLTVGTDCAVGKKYAALAIAREMRLRDIPSDFRATGQTGILIAGRGIAIDAVGADFVSGAAELLSPANYPEHWDVIEGQGSLFHPSYAGVALGLLHGSQPDAVVLCHDPGRTEIDDCPGFSVPPIEVAIARNLEAARLTNPSARCVGVALNTARYDECAALALITQTADALGVPCIDPLRWGAAAIVDTLQ